MSLVRAPLSSSGSSWPTCTVLASSGMSDPSRDEDVARQKHRLALGVRRLRLQDHEVERAARAGFLVDVADATRQGQRLAEADRAHVLELLLAVDEGHEVESQLLECTRAARQRLGHEGDRIGERRRCRVGALIGRIRVAQRPGEGGHVRRVDRGAARRQLPPDHFFRSRHRPRVWRNASAPVKESAVTLDHLILMVNDREKSLQFYTTILGLPYEGERDPFSVVRVNADTTLQLDPWGTKGGEHLALSLTREEFAATFQRVRYA